MSTASEKLALGALASAAPLVECGLVGGVGEAKTAGEDASVLGEKPAVELRLVVEVVGEVGADTRAYDAGRAREDRRLGTAPVATEGRESPIPPPQAAPSRSAAA